MSDVQCVMLDVLCEMQAGFCLRAKVLQWGFSVWLVVCFIFGEEYLVAWGIFRLVWMGCIVCCIGCQLFYIGYREYINVVCLFGGVDGAKACYKIEMNKSIFVISLNVMIPYAAYTGQ